MVEPGKEKINMGGVAWTKEEDQLLREYIKQFGEGKWNRVPLLAGLNRCRKSCRLRWLNYLRPNIKRGSFTEQERQLIIKLHGHVGNRWSLIAGRLPGRTANDVKNYWNCHLSKRLNAQATALEEKNAIIPLQPLGIKSKKPRPVDMGPSNNSQSMVEESSMCMSMTFEYVAEVEDHELVKEEESSCVGVEEPAGIVGDFATDHLGHIHKLNVLAANHGCGKLDWDALTLDMDLWTNSL